MLSFMNYSVNWFRPLKWIKGFAQAFKKATGKTSNKFKLPKFELFEIEDFYVYYVEILGISENAFWNADIPFLDGVVRNKTAFKNWENSIIEKERRK